MGYKTKAPMSKYGQTDLVESGESKAIKDIGAEIAHGIRVPALRMVKSINNIFLGPSDFSRKFTQGAEFTVVLKSDDF